MQRHNRVITTIGTIMISCPIVLLTISYAGLSCGEMDSCPTGGPMPYSNLAIATALFVTVVQAALLITIWRGQAGE